MSPNCGHQRAYCSSPMWYISMESHSEVIAIGENRRTRRKTRSIATLSTTKPIWTDPDANPRLCLERSVNSRLSHRPRFRPCYVFESVNEKLAVYNLIGCFSSTFNIVLLHYWWLACVKSTICHCCYCWFHFITRAGISQSGSMLRAERSCFDSRHKQRFFRSPYPFRLRSPHSFPYNRYRGSFPWVSRLGRQTHFSPPSSDEVKNTFVLRIA
jgi:hypothetical protein